MALSDPLDTPNCPVCLRPLEIVETGGVVLWDCGWCDLGRDGIEL